MSKSELFENLDKLRASEGKVALATLVNTRGTTPRKEGAQMLVGEGGRVLGSVTIGGCVDAQVIEESAGVLDRNRPRLLELDLGDEEAWEIGLTCGGTIEVFMEPVTLDRPGDATLAIYERARAHADAGGRAAIVTRLDATGSGGKMLILDTDVTEGSLGSVELDGRVRAGGGGGCRMLMLATDVTEGSRGSVELDGGLREEARGRSRPASPRPCWWTRCA